MQQLSVGQKQRLTLIPRRKQSKKNGRNDSVHQCIDYTKPRFLGRYVDRTDHLLAVSCPIMVMLMLVASTAISSVLVLSMVRKRCLGGVHKMIVAF